MISFGKVESVSLTDWGYKNYSVKGENLYEV